MRNFTEQEVDQTINMLDIQPVMVNMYSRYRIQKITSKRESITPTTSLFVGHTTDSNGVRELLSEVEF